MITLQNEALENKLVSLSKKLNIQASELLETFINDKLNEEKSINNISHIEPISKKENENILSNLNHLSKEDKEIDHKATTITHI